MFDKRSGGRTTVLSKAPRQSFLDKGQEGDLVPMRQVEVRRKQWKDCLPTPVRTIGRHGKSVGKRLLGVRKTQWLRVVMDGQTEKFVRSLSYASMDALEVSGNKWERFGFRSYKNVYYPDYDLCEKPLATAAFDIVIVEQVLEHVLWPYRAVRNVFELLRPGGVFLVTTPFLVRMHEPVDCSRWSELGLKNLLIEGGFSSGHITTGSWGNRACVRSNFQTWTEWIPWKHSLKNEPKFPLVVWAFAQKTVATNLS